LISPLQALELQMNQIKGALPSSIGDSLTELEYLWLGDNQLTGLVPSSYGKLTKLTDVVLSPNPFEKPLPVPKREETAVSYMQRCVKDHN
jgi:Leucine-rich repeat (LRR) protein